MTTMTDPLRTAIEWLVAREAEQHLAHVLETIAADPELLELEAMAAAGHPEAFAALERTLITLSHGLILEGLADVIGLEGSLWAAQRAEAARAVPTPPAPPAGRLRAAWARIRAR